MTRRNTRAPDAGTNATPEEATRADTATVDAVERPAPDAASEPAQPPAVTATAEPPAPDAPSDEATGDEATDGPDREDDPFVVTAHAGPRLDGRAVKPGDTVEHGAVSFGHHRTTRAVARRSELTDDHRFRRDVEREAERETAERDAASADAETAE